MGDLQRLTIADLGELFDGPHATPTRRDAGPYFLSISSLKSGRLDLAESNHVSEEDFTKWTRRVIPQANDLLFSYETRLGEAALMPNGIRACLGRRMALLRPDESVVDPRFLIYYYLSPEFQRIIETNTIHGATVNRIGLATMPEWEVRIPELAEQRAIAEVLGALDDKIAANDRVVSSAEELMVSHATTASSHCRVDDLARQSKESVKAGEFGDEVKLFSLPAFDQAKIPEYIDSGTIKSSKFVLRNPCVLFSKLNPRISRIWDVNALPDELPVASTEFVVLVPHELPSSLLWAVLSDPAVSRRIASTVAGTSGSHQRVKPAELLQTSVRDPRTLSPRIQDILVSLGETCSRRREESVMLGQIRDSLLPLLMSGEVRVRDAEKVVEEVV